jgi:hypothetical protein
MQDIWWKHKVFECRHFKLEQHLVYGILQFDHFYDFNADFFTCFLIDTLMNGAAVALSNILVHFVSIVFYGLHLTQISNEFSIKCNNIITHSTSPNF